MGFIILVSFTLSSYTTVLPTNRKHITNCFIGKNKPYNYDYLQVLSYALKTQKGTRHAPTQNPPRVADAGRGRKIHPAAQHHVAACRHDPPCPARRSVTLGLLSFARTYQATQSALPLCLPIQQASLSIFTMQQTRQP